MVSDFRRIFGGGNIPPTEPSKKKEKERTETKPAGKAPVPEKESKKTKTKSTKTEPTQVAGKAFAAAKEEVKGKSTTKSMPETTRINIEKSPKLEVGITPLSEEEREARINKFGPALKKWGHYIETGEPYPWEVGKKKGTKTPEDVISFFGVNAENDKIHIFFATNPAIILHKRSENGKNFVDVYQLTEQKNGKVKLEYSDTFAVELSKNTETKSRPKLDKKYKQIGEEEFNEITETFTAQKTNKLPKEKQKQGEGELDKVLSDNFKYAPLDIPRRRPGASEAFIQ